MADESLFKKITGKIMKDYYVQSQLKKTSERFGFVPEKEFGGIASESSQIRGKTPSLILVDDLQENNYAESTFESWWQENGKWINTSPITLQSIFDLWFKEIHRWQWEQCFRCAKMRFNTSTTHNTCNEWFTETDFQIIKKQNCPKFKDNGDFWKDCSIEPLDWDDSYIFISCWNRRLEYLQIQSDIRRFKCLDHINIEEEAQYFDYTRYQLLAESWINIKSYIYNEWFLRRYGQAQELEYHSEDNTWTLQDNWDDAPQIQLQNGMTIFL